ncbi:C5a anaphylatoxin chemotactic receptor 1 [Tachyglossus aculeatus]|uniref:C5a anaphylatoxin chemotactic receptor 1 n=1 Tax=Tachyglossus aculeatus TaxID=9261 RepID=UPI0018F5AEDF|nr:C5a anaphylatoxin chemotactic receptor 1 [Tachyglossus aculeatus]XP_038622777.1 C5a anaphylatoxin chemotactic receptor 1 [Tachyglossus aculeatus]
MATPVSESPSVSLSWLDYNSGWDDEGAPSGRLSGTDVIGLIIYAVVFVVGVPGNAAVAWVTGAEARRTVNAVWFLHLSVADLLCCLSLPLVVVPLLRDGDWPLGDFACRVLPSLILLNMYASVLLLTAISADRCALALRPIWCQNHRTSRRAWAVCGASWALALLLTVPSFVYRSVHEEPFPPRTDCGQDYGGQKEVEEAVAAVRFVFGFLVPLAVIVGCYGGLLARVWGRRATRSPKTLKVVVAVVVGFFLCWCPYQVNGLLLASSKPTSALHRRALAVDSLTVSLAYINCCLNPVIYVVAGRGFQHRFRRSLRSVLWRALAEDSVGRDSKSVTRSTVDEKSSGL